MKKKKDCPIDYSVCRKYHSLNDIQIEVDDAGLLVTIYPFVKLEISHKEPNRKDNIIKLF